MSKEEMNPLMKNMLKSFLPMITKKLPEFEQFLHKSISEIQLNEGEQRAGIIISNGLEKVYVMTVAFDNNDTVTRIISKVSAVEFVSVLIKQI